MWRRILGWHPIYTDHPQQKDGAIIKKTASKFITTESIKMAQATKTTEKAVAAKKITAEEAKQVIRFFAKQGNFSFQAYYECFQKKCACKIDSTWKILGVTLNDSEFSFLASAHNQKPIKFMVRYDALKDAIVKWLTEMSRLIKQSVKTLSGQIPVSIVLFAGTTEYVPMKAKAV